MLEKKVISIEPNSEEWRVCMRNANNAIKYFVPVKKWKRPKNEDKA